MSQLRDTRKSQLFAGRHRTHYFIQFNWREIQNDNITLTALSSPMAYPLPWPRHGEEQLLHVLTAAVGQLPLLLHAPAIRGLLLDVVTVVIGVAVGIGLRRRVGAREACPS